MCQVHSWTATVLLGCTHWNLNDSDFSLPRAVIVCICINSTVGIGKWTDNLLFSLELRKQNFRINALKHDFYSHLICSWICLCFLILFYATEYMSCIRVFKCTMGSYMHHKFLYVLYHGFLHLHVHVLWVFTCTMGFYMYHGFLQYMYFTMGSYI